jgi:ADP-ribose pyrophosphatase YjhB (NUDIX family)
LWAKVPRQLRRRVIRLLTPSYTVGSIGVVEHDGKVLLVRLSYRNGWGMPGGLLERGEPPVLAVAREAREETGLAVEAQEPPVVVVDTKVRRVDVVFRCSLSPGVDPSAARATSPEILEARWWPVDDLPGMHREAADGAEVLRDARVAQFRQRLRLDLTGALAGDAEAAADLLERPRRAVEEPVAQLDHLTLAVAQP